MPFVSKAQRRWMYANHPGMARLWSKETPEWMRDSLPERKRPKRPKRPRRRP